jgi:hypothetical protein
VVVGIDKPGQQHVTAQIERLIRRLWKICHGPDLFDKSVADKKATVGEFPKVVIHRDNVHVLD